jgi:hypothetical protein
MPLGFVKIRHYGLLANRDREERLALCRALLALWGWVLAVGKLLGSADEAVRRRCPSCGSECWGWVAVWPRPEEGGEEPAGAAVPLADTS